jgi:hypothetical protein
MSHGGKGDKARPLAIPMEEFDKKFEGIFGESKLQKRIREEAEALSKQTSQDENK